MRCIVSEKWRPTAIGLALACFILLPLAARASGPVGETENPAKSILEKASKALGEQKTWTTRVEKGLQITWNTPGWGTLKADYTRCIKKPDKLKIDMDNSAYDHPFFRMYYYNGGDAWYVTNLVPGRNPTVSANMKNLIERVDGIAFYLAACDTFFNVPNIPDDSLLSGTGLERAGCVFGGDTVLFDINKKTNLLVRRIENKGKRVSIFEDYRNARGRKMPFHITVYDAGAKSNEFLWKEIAFDRKLNDSIFEENRPPKQ